MPLFVDMHLTEGKGEADSAGLAEVDARDWPASRHEGDSDLFWIGHKAGRNFWLVEAASAEAAQAVHDRAHAGVSSEIYEVQPGQPWFSRKRPDSQA